jgi:microcystin-dependent protein
MYDPFLGQIALFPIGYTPANWAECDGSLMAISQNRALFSLLGTAYGGNGTSTFGLPDLRGRAPVCFGQLPGGETYGVGQLNGAEGVLLTDDTVPPHVHRVTATDNPGTTNDPAGMLLATAQGGLLAESASGLIYKAIQPGPGTQLIAGSLLPAGTDLHNNMQPSLVLRYCIATQGIFPQRSIPATS